MKRLIAIAAIGLALVPTSRGLGQAKESEAEADAKQFRAVLDKMAAHLQSAPAYAVELASSWKIESEDKSRAKEGRNRFKLVREAGNKLRIEANPGDQLQPTIVSVSDGKQLITYLRPNGIFERENSSNAAAEVLRSPYLTTALQGTGIDLLLMPDWPSYLEKSISQLDFTGPQRVDGEELEHYQMNWGKDVVEMWFKPGNPSFLTQYRRTVTVPVQEQTNIRVITTAKLKWNLAKSFPAEVFRVDLPAVARKVPSVYDALVRGDKAIVLGKPAPRLNLHLLDGKPLDLTAHHGRKEVIVLLYFASWANPSDEGLAATIKVADEFKRKGVVSYGVNLGESREEVARFVAAQKIGIPVALDPQGDSTDDFLINSLPAAILIGKDGTVQAVLQGNEFAKDGANRISRDLERLVRGESLVELGR